MSSENSLRHARSIARRVPLALALVLVAAIGLRAWLWFAYQPAMMNLSDSVGYIYQLDIGVFNFPIHPAGYATFLLGLHELSSRVELTILLQHILGIATGLLLYATVRRFGAPVWVGVIAAAAVLLSLDQIFLEHAVLSEALFTFVLTLSLYACARAHSNRDAHGPRGWMEPRHQWLIAAGILLGIAACIRGIGAPLAAVIVIWTFFAFRGPLRLRLGNVAAFGWAVAVILFAYASLNYAASDKFALGETGGWALYSRAAPFADCAEFTPPAGTEPLCETTDPEDRPGPDFYGWDPTSPALEMFGQHANGDAELGSFARAAILAQPLEYAQAVGFDTLRFFAPDTALVPDWFEQRPSSGLGYEITDVDQRSPDFEQQVLASFRTRYPATELSIHESIGTLGSVQNVLRVHPALLALAVLLSIGGLFVARGSPRAGIALLFATSFLMLVISVATTIYTARYAIPAQGALVAAGAIGAWQIAQRLRDRRSRSRPAVG